MGNFCSIFHARFKNLIKVVPSTRKAHLLDYILLGWQTSCYKLKGSDQKWFMKPYDQIVKDTCIPLSTLERYIKELNDIGFIERRQALYSRTNEKGEFKVKKGAYICVTDKLLTLLNPSDTILEVTQNRAEHGMFNNESPPIQTTHQIKQSNIKNNEGIDPLKMRGSYISNLYSSSSINTISSKKLTQSVNKLAIHRYQHVIATVKDFLYRDIKEEISDEIKKMVLGTFFNLSFQYNKEFSSPKQMVAEYLFALLNIDFYLPQISCLQHRNNILAKVLRTNKWRTPKGFYKHFYMGNEFKKIQERREQQWAQQKDKEINQARDTKDNRLIQIENEMYEKSTLIDQLRKSIHQQSCEKMITKLHEQIQIERRELEDLWHQQAFIEQENCLMN